jgi:TonB family protein
MSKTRIILLAAILVLLGAGPLIAAQDQSAVFKIIEWEVKLRIFEGMKESLPAAPPVVTSSFLKYTFSANFRADSSLEQEQSQIKRIFGLKQVNLLTEGELNWTAGKAERVPFVFRLDGKEYTVQVKAGDFIAKPQGRVAQSFGVEVSEKTGQEKISLLDTEYNVSSQGNTTVLGFEDTQGKPYFISLQQTKMYADASDGSSFVGVVEGSQMSIRTPKEAGPRIIPPKLIKQVDPAYPEAAIKSGIAGMISIEATTDIYGRVASVKVLKSVPGLDQAAIEAVRQWVYEPMMIDGKPRPVIMTVSLNFRLGKDKEGRVRGVTDVLGGGALEALADQGVLAGVTGGVEGGVEGGVAGGVEGGVVGGIVGGVISPERREFEKGAVRAVGDIKPPTLIKSVEPVYPEIARQAQVEGSVIVEARTDEKGNVENVRILRSIPLLDQAAIDAVRQWKYEPMLIKGKPQKVVITVTVRFMLKSGDKEKDLERFAQGAVKAEGAIPPPKLSKSVDLVYPADAKKAGLEGTVILSVKTDASGKVQDVMILRSIPLLNQAAIDAVRQWVYEPLVINNVPTPVVFTVTVRFQLK